MGRRQRLDRPEGIDAILLRGGEDRFAPKKAPIPLPVWRAAVGPRIADQTVPLALQRKDGELVLVVRASSSTWASELSMLAETIVARLRRHGLDVRRLVFRTGRVELPERPIERRGTHAVPPPAPLPAALRRELDGVGDDELREAIAAAAARSLGFSESPRGARAPRSAGTGSAPPDRAAPADHGAAPRTRGGGRDRSR